MTGCKSRHPGTPGVWFADVLDKRSGHLRGDRRASPLTQILPRLSRRLWLRVRSALVEADQQRNSVRPGARDQPVTETYSGTAEVAGAIASASTRSCGQHVDRFVAAACCVSPVIAPIIVSCLAQAEPFGRPVLKPYGWWILGGALACLGFGFWTVYRPRRHCAIGQVSKTTRVLSTISKISLWFGAVCWTAGLLLRVLSARLIRRRSFKEQDEQAPLTGSICDCHWDVGGLRSLYSARFTSQF